MKKKVLGQLTEKQFDIFLRYKQCKEACKWLVRELLHEVEKQDVYLQRIWDKIEDKYCQGLSPEEFTQVELDRKTGEIYMLVDRDGTELGEQKLQLKKLDMMWESE